MKYLWLLAFICTCMMCSGGDDTVAGTATDVNSASVIGSLVHDGDAYKDTVSVALYRGDSLLAKAAAGTYTAVESLETATGMFTFDSLAAGTYSIRVTRQGRVVGEKVDVSVGRGQTVVVAIEITIVINQTFHIVHIDSSRDITVTNYYFTGYDGVVDTAGNAMIVDFTDRDTAYVTADVTVDGSTQRVQFMFVRRRDGTFAARPLDTDVAVRVDTGPTVHHTGGGTDSATVVIDGDVREYNRK